MSSKYHQRDPAGYQRLAGVAHQAVLDRVWQVFEPARALTQGDAGPIIFGALTAILDFATSSEATDDEIRAGFLKALDEMLPQLRMEQAAPGVQAGQA